ncbi:MAG: HIRAN domain-containing protein [Proteobacteria bacterium]|nr:HIRAN domain-containing protein [Pseudomonadota bacterium]MCL2308308.1 HIRAN domain-containing protein [Pseudomonadota bacterium]
MSRRLFFKQIAALIGSVFTASAVRAAASVKADLFQSSAFSSDAMDNAAAFGEAERQRLSALSPNTVGDAVTSIKMGQQQPSAFSSTATENVAAFRNGGAQRLSARSSNATGGSAALGRVELQRSPVAGFQYHQGEDLWPALFVGAALNLVREPDNAYDPRAVRVDWLGQKLGYVPRLDNAAVSHLLDAGHVLDAEIVMLRDSDNPWKRVEFAVFLSVR